MAKGCSNCKIWPERQPLLRVPEPKEKVVRKLPPFKPEPNLTTRDFSDFSGRLNHGISLPNYHVEEGQLFRRHVTEDLKFDRMELLADFSDVKFGDKTVPQ